MGRIRCRLSAVLADREMTKVELAELLGCHPTTITRMANPKTVDMRVLADLCEILRTTPGELYVYEPSELRVVRLN